MSSKKIKVTLSTIVERRNDLPTVDLDGEVGLMNVENGEYYGMDPIGSRIWELVEKPKAVSEIVSLLIEEYDVEENVCQEQVLDFINSLVKKDLVNIDDIKKVKE